jgi:hypothetical protein
VVPPVPATSPAVSVSLSPVGEYVVLVTVPFSSVTVFGQPKESYVYDLDLLSASTSRSSAPASRYS